MKLSFDLEQLVKEMNWASREIGDLPDESEYTEEEIADLDDIRSAALMLVREVEAAIEVFQGSK